MKTVKVAYPVHPFYCPGCKALYFTEVECRCLNTLEIIEDQEFTPKESSHGIKIIGVKAVGICSKCWVEGDEIIKDTKGKEIEDKDIACVNEAFGSCKNTNKKQGGKK